MTNFPANELKNKGVIYCISGSYLYILYEFCSMLSLRSRGYGGPILLITDISDTFSLPKSILGFQVKTLDVQSTSMFSQRWAKTQMDRLSPFDVSLYLDADTLVLNPIDSIWGFAEHCDVALALDIHGTLSTCDHSSPPEWQYTSNMLQPEFPQFNTGVILWRKGQKTSEFFHQWHDEWTRFRHIDQLAAMRALYIVRPKVIVLSSKFNRHLGRIHDLTHILESDVNVWHSWRQKESVLLLFPHLSKRYTSALALLILSLIFKTIKEADSNEPGSVPRQRVNWLSFFFLYCAMASVFGVSLSRAGRRLFNFLETRWGIMK